MKIEKIKKEKEKYVYAFQELIATWKLLNSFQEDFTKQIVHLIQKDTKANQGYKHLITALSAYEDSIYKAIYLIYGKDSELLSFVDNHLFTETDKIHISALLEDKYDWLFENMEEGE